MRPGRDRKIDPAGVGELRGRREPVPIYRLVAEED